jgi:hypothetical protein
LVSCLFLEDFPEVPSIADVRRCGEKYRAMAGRFAIRGWARGDCAAQSGARGILLESNGVGRLLVHGGDFMAQNFKNHARYVPVFHFFVLPILLLNVGWEIHRVVVAPSAGSVKALLVALALFLAALYGRMFALAVQDRLIRLEMQLRLQGLLPVDLRARIPEFTVGQLVALRFASDTELPGLAAKVLAENLQDRKAIKGMIRNWQSDELRA